MNDLSTHVSGNKPVGEVFNAQPKVSDNKWQCVVDLPDHQPTKTLVYPAWDIRFLQPGDESENQLCP